MTDKPVEEFLQSAQDVGVTVTRAVRGDVTAAIADRTTTPAVGVSLPFDDVSLPDDVIEDPSMEQLQAAQTGITSGLFGVASYGTVAVASTQAKDGPISLYPPRHIAVIESDSIVPDMAGAFTQLDAAFADGTNDIVFVTGPSSTADMGELVTGVHGPSEMHVILIEQ